MWKFQAAVNNDRSISFIWSGAISELNMAVDGECAPEQGRVTFWLVACTLMTTMCGSFQFGYQLGVMTGPSKMIQQFYNESHDDREGEFLGESVQLWLWSTTVSVLCVGGAVGALISSYLADAFGRKGFIWFLNIFSISGGLLMGLSYLAKSYEMVIIGRLIIGVYVGASLAIVPMYLAEISPVNLRGSVGMIHQFMVTIGIVTSQVLGLFVLNYDTGWPILLALTAVPSLIQLCVLPLCPESPRWLFIRKREETKALKVLRKLRGTRNVDKEVADLRRESNKRVKKVGILTLLKMKNPAWRRPFMISVCLNVGQQLSGINAILFYATEIFYQAGMNDIQVACSTVGTGVATLMSTLLAIPFVESIGRKPLLLGSFLLMTTTTALLVMSLGLQEKRDGWKWFSLILVYTYMFVFAAGSGSVTNVVVTELWDQGPRSAAVSVAIQAKWWANLIIGLAFPFLQDSLGIYSFLIMTFFSLSTTVFVFLFVPETKGRTFTDITSAFELNDYISDENQKMNPKTVEESI